MYRRATWQPDPESCFGLLSPWPKASTIPTRNPTCNEHTPTSAQPSADGWFFLAHGSKDPSNQCTGMQGRARTHTISNTHNHARAQRERESARARERERERERGREREREREVERERSQSLQACRHAGEDTCTNACMHARTHTRTIHEVLILSGTSCSHLFLSTYASPHQCLLSYVRTLHAHNIPYIISQTLPPVTQRIQRK
jgi:hypothetical protein